MGIDNSPSDVLFLYDDNKLLPAINSVRLHKSFLSCNPFRELTMLSCFPKIITHVLFFHKGVLFRAECSGSKK